MKQGDIKIVKIIANYLGYSIVAVNHALEGKKSKPLVITQVKKCLERYLDTGKVYVDTPDEIVRLKLAKSLEKEVEDMRILCQKAKTKHMRARIAEMNKKD